MKDYKKLAMLVQEIQGELEGTQVDILEELIPMVAVYLEKKIERRDIDELLNKVHIPQKSKLMEIEMIINNMEKDVDAVSQVLSRLHNVDVTLRGLDLLHLQLF